MTQHKLLSTGNILVIDLPGSIEVELKPLSRSQLKRVRAMDDAINIHRKKFEENPDLLLDPLEYEKYIDRELKLQSQSDAAMLQMMIARWGDRDSLTTLELQSEQNEAIVADLLVLISRADVMPLLFRKNGVAASASEGMAKAGVES